MTVVKLRYKLMAAALIWAVGSAMAAYGWFLLPLLFSNFGAIFFGLSVALVVYAWFYDRHERREAEEQQLAVLGRIESAVTRTAMANSLSVGMAFRRREERHPLKPGSALAQFSSEQ